MICEPLVNNEKTGPVRSVPSGAIMSLKMLIDTRSGPQLYRRRVLVVADGYSFRKIRTVRRKTSHRRAVPSKSGIRHFARLCEPLLAAFSESVTTVWRRIFSVSAGQSQTLTRTCRAPTGWDAPQALFATEVARPTQGISDVIQKWGSFFWNER
jgi:hypothetical protein